MKKKLGKPFSEGGLNNYFDYKLVMRIISGHQPCYLPWLGLFHKLSLCDCFVFMDTVQYLEQDWNNRNKIRTSQGWQWLSIPVDRNRTKGKSLNQIYLQNLSSVSPKEFWQEKHWLSIVHNYGKSPFFSLYAEQFEQFYRGTLWDRLTDLCFEQLKFFLRILELDTIELVRMSEHHFAGSKDELILDHCLKLHGDAVVFGMHGKDYVRSEIFHEHGVQVYFQDYQHPVYTQKYPQFESHMALIDLLFNHGPESREILLRGNRTKEDLLTGRYWVK
ncbi:MAG: WbqC family protein [Bdellovibrionales bacterium]|nr:WbqC family protein [Bdellovibrionales bacterium]